MTIMASMKIAVISQGLGLFAGREIKTWRSIECLNVVDVAAFAALDIYS
jgi:hypothetical protein